MARGPGEKDYRDLRKPDAPEKGSHQQTAYRWWTLKEDKAVANSIVNTVLFLQKHQAARVRQATINARLYGNLSMHGGAGVAYARLLRQHSAKERITFNAVQSIVDTITARVGEQKPRPYFLTSGGNYKEQRKAKKLNQYVEGVFYETQAYKKGLKSFRDSAIGGDGFQHVFARNGKIHHEHVQPTEIWVDEIEAQYGFPRTLYRVKLVDRDELAGAYPDAEEDIARCSRAVDPFTSAALNISDMLTVVEAWHLPAMDEKGEPHGGKHTIAIENALVLPMEDWDNDFFPFAKIPWCERPIGYWSQGLAEQLQGEQIELNKELWLIQRSMHLAGMVKVFLKNGSKIVKEHINNEIGGIVNYTGDPPTFYVPEPIHPVYFENVNRIIDRMFQKAGVSQLSAAGKKPLGLNAGVALRESQDIENDRFSTIARQNNDFYLAIAALDVAAAKQIVKAKGSLTVRTPGRNSFAEINFRRDIGDLKDSQYVMQCFPVSKLPRDPSGRLQTITEYIQAQMITPRQGRRALDFPDLETVESLANAQEDVLSMVLDGIIDDGKYRAPEPTDDLDLAHEMVLEYIQRFRTLDLEDERMTMLRYWNSQVVALKQAAMPPPMPGLGAPGAGPPAPGGNGLAVAAAPPVSELLPMGGMQ